MAYSLDELLVRQHHQFFEARHSGGYFERVIALHPLADRVTALRDPIESKPFSDRQDVIEGKAAGLNLPKWLFPLDLFISQRRLLSHVVGVVRQAGVSLISATDPLYSGLFGLWVKNRTGVPLVIHLVANYDLNFDATGSLAMPRMFPTRAIEKAVVRYMLRKADLVAAGSETLRAYAIAQGASPDRVEVFRVAKNIVPAHRVPPDERKPLTKAEKDRFGIAGTDRLLLTVARLEPVKMVDHSIKAFSVVARDHPDALLLLAGDGSQRSELEKLAASLGLADRVRFLGLVPQEFLSRLEPHCLVLSPLTGMALFETSLAGCPTVAYDCDSAVTEMIDSGINGIVVPPRDWEAMGEAASQILRDPAAYERMSRGIRARAELLTDEKRLYGHEHAVFDQLLAD